LKRGGNCDLTLVVQIEEFANFKDSVQQTLEQAAEQQRGEDFPKSHFQEGTPKTLLRGRK
jgi:hypothetical protein